MDTPTGERSRPARKRFGQHFLETAWAEKLVHAIDPQPTHTFLEIGPGRGAITRPLTARAGKVLAFEIDRNLASDLQEQAPLNLSVVERDFLSVTADEVMGYLPGGREQPLRVAGNLPYNVASPILFKLIELADAGLPLEDATIMLQREVADRLLARPGTRDYGSLTVRIRHRALIDRLLNLPPGAFRPSPQVHSTVVRLRFHAADPPVKSPDVFAALIQTMFTLRRKMLTNALQAYASGPLTASEALALAGIDPQRRPETLDIPEIARLADVFASAPQGA